MYGLGHCGCSNERLGSVFPSQGSTPFGAIAPSTGGGNEVYVDLAIGAAAFTLPIVYAKVAPKRWPHPKKTWQEVAAVVGLYFLGTYIVRKVV